MRSMNRGARRMIYWFIPCLIYLYAAGRAPRVEGRDLMPWPDALEYALLTQRLADGEAPLIKVGLHEYPSRYSLAFSALQVPVYWLVGGDVTRLHYGAMLYGVVAVSLMALAGHRLFGSRTVGALAATFWALHPQTAKLSALNMSETALTMMFFVMLLLARPLWERPAEGRMTTGRAALLGLAVAWLTVAKAPFVYWAVAWAALTAYPALLGGSVRPAAALIGTGLVVALADGAYRQWAFSTWKLNGYAFWLPDLYANLFQTFNVRFLREPFDPTADGNLVYYGRMVLGRTHDFYGPYMALAAIGSGGALAWPWRRGRPCVRVIGLLAGWLVVGILFCGTYFFQCERFPFLWIPVIDLAAAWGLVRLGEWWPLRRGWPGRLGARNWVRVGLALVALLIARGEFRRVHNLVHESPGRDGAPRVAQLRALLAPVPEGAWIFANLNPVLIDAARPRPGPTGALYYYHLDALFTGHVHDIERFGLPRWRTAPGMETVAAGGPVAWRESPPLLIGLDGGWVLSESERAALFAQPVYLVLFDPVVYPVTGDYLRQTIQPLLNASLKLEPVGVQGEFILLRATNRASPS